MILMEIKQILPAGDWYALYEQEMGEAPVADRIMVWASVIMQDGGEAFPSVVGFSDAGGFLECVEDCFNFQGYCHKDDLEVALARKKELK